MYAQSPNKLAPRSISCVFLGYSDEHKGFRCLDLLSVRIHISRHVTYVENVFPFSQRSTSSETDTSTTTSSPRRPTFNPLYITPNPTPPHSSPTPAAAAETAANPAMAACDNTAASGSAAAADLAENAAAADFPATPPDPASPMPAAAVDFPAATPDPASPMPASSAAPGNSSPSPLQPFARDVPIIKPTNEHLMRTRAKSGFKLPTQKLNLNVTPSISPIPKSYKSALLDPH
jgi:hypothetical protein